MEAKDLEKIQRDYLMELRDYMQKNDLEEVTIQFPYPEPRPEHIKLSDLNKLLDK